MLSSAEFVLPSADYTVGGSRLRSSRFPNGIVDSSRGLICIPGYSTFGDAFARLRPLAKAYDLHLLTLPEEATRGLDPIARFASVVETFAERFHRPVLLGTSFGGAVAIKAAAALGPRLSGLILISTFASLPRMPARAILPLLPLLEWFSAHAPRVGARFAGGKHLDRAAALELIREASSSSNTEKHARLVAAMHCNLETEASRIDVPVLIIHGTADHVVPFTSATRLMTLIPHAELHEVPDAGHLPYLTHATVVNTAISEFLTKCFVVDRLSRRLARAS